MQPRTVLAAIAALTLVACGGGSTDPGTSPTAAVIVDAATTAAAVTSSEVSRMVSPAGTALTASPSNPDPTLGCAFSGGHFLCGVQVAGGLTGTTTVTLYDTSGNIQAAYDSIETASVHFDTDVFGSTSVGPWDAIVGRHRRLVETGLAGLETARTWNGTGNDTLQVIDSTGGTPTRSYTIFATVTVTNVVVPAPGSPARWPTSGSMTQQLYLAATSGESSGLTFRLQAAVMFNGTPLVPLTVGGRAFVLNLNTGIITESG